MHSTLTWIARIALGLGLAAAALVAIVVIGPLVADGFATLARPHAL